MSSSGLRSSPRAIRTPSSAPVGGAGSRLKQDRAAARSRRRGGQSGGLRLGDLVAFMAGGLLRRGWVFIVVAALTWLLAEGHFAPPVAGDSAPWQSAVIALLTFVIGLKLWDRLPGASASEQASGEYSESKREDAAVSLLMVAAAYVLIQRTGGVVSPLYPVLYVVVTIVSAFASRAVVAGFTAYAVGLELLVAPPLEVAPVGTMAVHAGAIVVFALLVRSMLFGLVTWLRRDHTERVTQFKGELLEQARYYRLAGRTLADESARYPDADRDERRLLGSAAAVRDSVNSVLNMVQTLMPSHTLAVLLTDPSGKHMTLREALSENESLARGAWPSREGVPGVVLKQGAPVRLSKVRPGYPGFPYYATPPSVREVIAVPLLEGEEGEFVRGVLIADRIAEDAEPFSDADERVLQTAAGEVLRACEVERVLADLDREKTEKEKFYVASQELNEALTLEQVMDTALAASHRFIPYDFAAITLYESQREKHRVVRCAGADTEKGQKLDFVGTSFADNGSLVAAAVKTQHPMPYVTYGKIDKRRQVIFTPETRVPGLKTLQVFPLMVKNEPIGTLVVGSRARDSFNHDEWNMLRVIANQLAVSVENAKMYAEMEQKATTDGLTGLNNHRRFQELLDEALARAERFDRKVSLILTDIDHFKSVNDTYGHPVGDVVLKRVSRVLGDQARETDSVSRYGGEEFAVIMEETDAEGAFTVAERIREAVSRQIFNAEQGKFRVTLSLGCATFPDDSKVKQELIELTDNALYAAKHGGRNQTRLHSGAGTDVAAKA